MNRALYEVYYDGSYTGDAGGGYVAPVSSATYAPKDSPTFTGTVTLQDAANFVFGTTTGTKLGTASTQKLGLWGATPIVQPTALTALGAAVGGTAGAAYTATEQTMINDLKTLANNLRTIQSELTTRLQAFGFIP